MRRKASSLVQRMAPRSTARLRYKRALQNLFEPEQVLLPILSSRLKTSVDVGASDGAYSFPLVDLSRSVLAIEPRKTAANRLAATGQLLGLPLEVLNVALSSTPGEKNFRCIRGDEGRSTIEDANPLDNFANKSIDERLIKAATLDSLALENVGFIKIDVEGHELAVLAGGSETIRRNLPCLIVEIEERHSPGSLEACSKLLRDHGYGGFFLDGAAVRDISEFNANLLQNPRNIGDLSQNYARSGKYVNNFVFVPEHKMLDVVQRATALAGTVVRRRREIVA